MNGIKCRQPEEMRDSGIEWLGMVPREWQITRLKFVMKINPIKSEVKKSNQLCSFVPMNKLHNGIVETDEEKMIKDIYDGYTYFRNGDIVMAKVTPCFENGNIAIAKNLTNNVGFGSTEIHVLRVNQFYDKTYVYYSFQENHFVRYGSSHMTGVAGLKRVPASYIENHRIAIPGLNEQQKIANFLDIKTAQFDSIIAKKELLIQKLEEAKKSLISEVVTGKVKIVDGEMVPRQPEEMKDSGVEWLGMVPKEWEVRRIKYLLRESSNRSLYGKEEPLSMSQKYGLIRSVDMDRIPNQALNLKGNKICEEGDLVFNKLKSHLGVFSVANQEGIVSPDYAVYRSLGNSDTKYLEYLFKTPQYINEFNRYSKGVGAGLTRLYTDDLFNIVALYPRIDEQKHMVKHISNHLITMDSAINIYKSQIQKLQQAKQALISEAVTGKIDLRDWEIIEEGELP